MATSLIVPLAYITVLVASLAIFSRIYRKRRAAEKTTWEAWLPSHPSRDIYISLLSSSSPVPDSVLKSALLVRATADVKRIWRIRDDKMALTNLHTRGLVGDDTMARFAAAEKELEAEIVDVVSEANTFRQGWGGMIFQTATEMAHAERTREIVLNIPKAKAREEKRMLKRRKLMGEPAPTLVNMPTQPSTPSGTKAIPSNTTPNTSTPSNPLAQAVAGTPSKTPAATSVEPTGLEEDAAVPAREIKSGSNSGQNSGANTPSKSTPGKKKKGKK